MAVALSVLSALAPIAAQAEDPASPSSTASSVSSDRPSAELVAGPTAGVDLTSPGPSSPAVELRQPSSDHKALSLGIVGGVFAVLYGYTYLAWHMRAENSPTLQFREEGWFGVHTYAGGADKLGHAWSNYAITRGMSGILEWGGWSKQASLLIATGTTLGFFFLSEFKDGYAKEYGFSWGDVISNLTGDALALLLETFPTLDRMFDFRLEYWPSEPFRRSIATQGPFNSSEDYTGQRFLLSYHLSSIDLLRESKYFGWSEYLDVSLGFHAAHFKPDDTDSEPHSQELFVGLSLDLRRVIENTLMPDAESQPPAGVRALHFFTRIYQPPFTTLALGGLSRRTPDPAPQR